MKTIIRVNKNPNNPYVMMDKRPLENPSLSYKAKGILAYLLSRPDDWTINLKDLINRSTDGRDGVKSGLKELDNAGHISITQERDEKGKFTKVIYTVHELPLTENPLTEKPLTEKPLNTNINNTNTDGTNIINTESKMLSIWENVFPDKTQPRPGTHRNKITTRCKDEYYISHFQDAINYASKREVGRQSWFQFEWLVRNNRNALRIASGEFDWMDNKKNNKPKRGANLDVWDKAKEAIHG